MAHVGRNLKDHEAPTPQHRHHQPPHLILDQAAQGPIQPGPEHLQGQGIMLLHYLSESQYCKKKPPVALATFQ